MTSINKVAVIGSGVMGGRILVLAALTLVPLDAAAKYYRPGDPSGPSPEGPKEEWLVCSEKDSDSCVKIGGSCGGSLAVNRRYAKEASEYYLYLSRIQECYVAMPPVPKPLPLTACEKGTCVIVDPNPPPPPWIVCDRGRCMLDNRTWY